MEYLRQDDRFESVYLSQYSHSNLSSMEIEMSDIHILNIQNSEWNLLNME